MTPRIPPMTTPVAGDGGDANAMPINALWYRYLQDLQSSSGVPEAPSNGLLYGRKNQSWRAIITFDATSDGFVPAPQEATGERFLRDDGLWVKIKTYQYDFSGIVNVDTVTVLPPSPSLYQLNYV